MFCCIALQCTQFHCVYLTIFKSSVQPLVAGTIINLYTGWVWAKLTCNNASIKFNNVWHI